MLIKTLAALITATTWMVAPAAAAVIAADSVAVSFDPALDGELFIESNRLLVEGGGPTLTSFLVFGYLFDRDFPPILDVFSPDDLVDPVLSGELISYGVSENDNLDLLFAVEEDDLGLFVGRNLRLLVDLGGSQFPGPVLTDSATARLVPAPIPLPASGGLLLASLATIAGCRRRLGHALLASGKRDRHR